MSRTLKLISGTLIKWRDRQFVITDLASLDAVIAQEVGKNTSEKIPVAEILPAGAAPDARQIPELKLVEKRAWKAATKRFEAIRHLVEQDRSQRSLADIQATAAKLGKHTATIYRWLEEYARSGRISALLRKERSDRGGYRLSAEIEKIVKKAINEIYLTEEKPDPSAVVEEVELQCFKLNLKPPHSNTVRNRIAMLSDRLKLEKRVSKKAAKERFEPIKGSFPGADFPLAVTQIDHTPMDVIVVDEVDREPIDRPHLTIAIDIYSCVLHGFAIYLEKPSAFATGLCIAHAVLPKEDWMAEVGVDAPYPCYGKMRTIHCDNAKEFRGTVIGKACQEHGINIEHRPVKEPRYGGHVERAFRTFMARVHRVKGTTFSNIEERAEYNSEGKAVMTLKELERWFTIFVAKYYHQRYHRGIKMPPIAKYEDGILGNDQHPGIGLPEVIVDQERFRLDFLPYEERTVQEYGILIDHIFYYSDVLRPWIHARDPENPKKTRTFVCRENPRDKSTIWFWDPSTDSYAAIPYRDTSHPPVSRWEVLAAEKKLRERGYKRVNEALIFEGIEEMRDIEQKAEYATKKMRRSRQKRKEAARGLPGIGKPKPQGSATLEAAPPSPPSSDDCVMAFDDIDEADL